MVDLPQKKVGIIACSGEEMAEGTVSRLTALKVLEQLRPDETVTICLPLFLAGGEGDRAFAKFYPTIAIDGCEKQCAFRGTEQYSNRPAGGIVISAVIKEQGLESPHGSRKLNQAGMQAVDLAAERVAQQVDHLLGKQWSRRDGTFDESAADSAGGEAVATCSCGSGIPVQKVKVTGQELTVVALPLIFQNMLQNGKNPGFERGPELLEMIKIYNQIDPAVEDALMQVVIAEYANYCAKEEH